MDVMFWCVEYIASFVEMYMGTYFCSTFVLQEVDKYTKRKMIGLSVLGAGLIIGLNRIELFSYITAYIVIVFLVLIQWVCYKKKYLLCLGLVLVYEVFLVLIDFMVLYLASVIMTVSTEYILAAHGFIRLACVLLSKSILIIVVVSLNQFLSYKKLIRPLYIILMCLCSLFLFLSNLVLVHLELSLSNETTSSFTIFFFITSFGIELLLFFLILKMAENHEQTQTNLLIEMNNKMLQKSLKETEQTFELWRHSVHDYKNHVIALRQMAEENKYEEIKTYLAQESEIVDKKMFLFKTGNSVVDTIVNIKSSYAMKHDIAFMVHAKLSAELGIRDIDIATILGNLLDNAIEASLQEENPYIEIDMKMEKQFLIIKIRNRCTEFIDIELRKTNKENIQFHGIGLKSVSRVVKKYDGEMNLEHKNQEYKVTIMIPT